MFPTKKFYSEWVSIKDHSKRWQKIRRNFPGITHTEDYCTNNLLVRSQHLDWSSVKVPINYQGIHFRHLKKYLLVPKQAEIQLSKEHEKSWILLLHEKSCAARGHKPWWCHRWCLLRFEHLQQYYVLDGQIVNRVNQNDIFASFVLSSFLPCSFFHAKRTKRTYFHSIHVDTIPLTNNF